MTPKRWPPTSGSWKSTRSRCFALATFQWWASGSRCRSSASQDRAVGDDAFNEIFHPIAERLLQRCDAVLRVGGPSEGADLMVRLARERGLAVYRALRDVPGCETAAEPGA
jgi:hypothetical protein